MADQTARWRGEGRFDCQEQMPLSSQLALTPGGVPPKCQLPSARDATERHRWTRKYLLYRTRRDDWRQQLKIEFLATLNDSTVVSRELVTKNCK